jgi:hypothetical protein
VHCVPAEAWRGAEWHCTVWNRNIYGSRGKCCVLWNGFPVHVYCGTDLILLRIWLGQYFGPRGKFLCCYRLKDPSEDDDEGEESLLDEMDDDLSNQNSSNNRFLQQQKTSSATLPIRVPSSRPVCSNVYITTGSPLFTAVSRKTYPTSDGHRRHCA